MTPYLYQNRRATRFSLGERTSVVLQFPDSHAIQCELDVISRTGGLLSAAGVIDPGSQATLMLRTHKGLLFATVEMLPAAANRRPFRFVDLSEHDRRTLQSAFQSEMYRNTKEEELIEEFRSAITVWDPPRKAHLSHRVLIGATLAALCSSVIYILSMHLR